MKKLKEKDPEVVDYDIKVNEELSRLYCIAEKIKEAEEESVA